MFFSDEKEKAREILFGLGLPLAFSNAWYWQYPVRAVEEIVKMMDNTNAILDFEESQMVWHEVIRNNLGTEYRYMLVVDQSFPFVMPDVHIIEPEISYADSKHRYSDGRLCLMHPDEFQSSMDILSFRNQTCGWIFAYNVW